MIVFDEFVILLDLYIYESRENKKFLQIQILYRYAISFENKFVTRENFSAYQPAEREQKEAKNPSTSNSQTLPSRLIPIQFQLFSKKKKKKRRERDSIKFSYRSRRSSNHARRFIATCGRNPLGISRYSSVGEKCGQKPVTKTRWPRKIWGTILLTKRARGNKNRPPPPLKPTRSVGFSTVVVKSE